METWNILCAILLAIPIATEAASWSYSGATGPANWASIDARCGGNAQSPIDFKSSEVTYGQNLGKFSLSGYSSPDTTYQMDNTGYTLKLTLGHEMKANVSAGGLPGLFTLVQLHFHWASNNTMGSEHTVGQKAYPLEVHFVHYNTKYSSINEALNHTDGLAVLGVFFELDGSDNTDLKNMLDHISNVSAPGSKAMIPKFDLTKMMPSNKDEFYRYNGSLTTPTCNEAVTWTVFKNVLKVSDKQMKLFRALKSAQNGTIEMNYRPVQKVNGRTIYATFSAPATTVAPTTSAFSGKQALSAAFLTVILCAFVGLFLKY